jgi:nitrite reductase/ring-hydroxylating ferredoxin subunit
MRLPLCRVEEIPEYGLKTVSFFEREVLVLKAAGKLKVYLNSCTHLGGSLKRQGDVLVCQSHGAEFDCCNGHCLAGPPSPGTRLLELPTLVENGLLIYSADYDYHPGDTFAQILPVLIRQNGPADPD